MNNTIEYIPIITFEQNGITYIRKYAGIRHGMDVWVVMRKP